MMSSGPGKEGAKTPTVERGERGRPGEGGGMIREKLQEGERELMCVNSQPSKR
jgi:hypothetical protein